MQRLLGGGLAVALGLWLARTALQVVGGDAAYFASALFHISHLKPFVYRMLVPFVLRAMGQIIGAPLEVVGPLLVGAACIGWLLALLYFARALFAWPLAVMVVLLAPFLVRPFLSGMYLYDIPSLALMTLGLGFLARHQWRAYLALFPIGVLCHEVFAFLLVVYVLQAWPHRTRRALWVGAGAQLAMLVLIKLALAVRFAANVGSLAQNHLEFHYWYWTHYPAAHIAFLVLLAAVVLVVLWRFRKLPAELQPAVVLVPMFLFAYLAFGFPFEIRAIIGIYPVLLLVGVALIVQLAAGLALRLPRPRTLPRATGA